MTIIYPGLGLGGTYRPRLAGTMGYAPVGSVLPPVGEITSAEPIGEIISDQPDSVTSDEIADVISSLEELLIESVEVTNVVSEEAQDATSFEPVGEIDSEEPSDIISDEPTDGIESEEPT